jgi:hypothetical protein
VRRIVIGLAVAALLATAVIARHALLKVALQGLLGAATGYEVRFGDVQVGWSHAVLRDVKLRSRGDPFLDAERIDLDYAPRDLFPGGHHRYGFVGIAIRRPTLTLVRHPDGSYNIVAGGVTAQPPAAAKRIATPLLFSARLRDGTIRLVDQAPLQRDLAEQSIVGLSVDASVDSETRTAIKAAGAWIGRRTAGAPLERWPIVERSVIDDERGFAMHRVRARDLPIRGVLGFVLHAPVARFDDGMLRDVDVMAYSPDVAADRPVAYHLGGGARLDDARLSVQVLAKPLRGLGGQIVLSDDGVTTPRIAGTLAGIPLRAQGGLFDFKQPKFRVGVVADVELRTLRTAFSFMNDKPLSGQAHLETLIAGSVDGPFIRTSFEGPRLYYDSIPVDRVGAIIDYARDEISVAGGHGDYGSLAAVLDGDIHIQTGKTPMRFVLRTRGPASALPYAQDVAAGETLAADAIVAGTAEDGFHAYGTLALAGPDGSGEGFMTVDERGIGEFGPFAFTRADGSELVGALRMERDTSSAAGWLYARNYRLDIPAHVAVLPGLAVAPFPPFGGRLNAAVAGGGTPSAFAVAGTVHAEDARYDRYPLGVADARLGGFLDDLRLEGIAIAGPIGRFRGAGAFHADTFALTGRYDGSFEQLIPFTGDIGTRGEVGAPVAVLAGPTRIVVQTTGAAIRHGSVQGVPFERAAGTLAIAGPDVQVIAADARLAGTRVVAAARDPSRTAISVVGLPADALRQAGMPLDGGRVSMFGIGDLRGPRFAGTVDLDNGTARGYPVHGWADLAYAAGGVTVADGVGAVGGTYGEIGGRVTGVTGPQPRYQLNAIVPLGDAAALVHDFRLPLPSVAGTYSARLTIGGSGAAPQIGGTVSAPEGSYHGLSFRDGSARLTVAPPVIGIDGGTVTVGSTLATVSATAGPDHLAFHIASAAADLADFDGYFDPGDALAGRGRFDLGLDSRSGALISTGSFELRGARFLHYAFGDAVGRWSTSGATISGSGSLAGPGGTLSANGTFVPANGDLLHAFTAGRYDADIKAADVDLGRWIVAAGFSFPFSGQVDAGLHVAGTFPQLAIGAQASLRDGAIAGYPIRTASATANIAGGRVTLQNAVADLGFVQLASDGSFGLGAADPLALHLHAAAPDLAAALRRVDPHGTTDIGGALDVDTVITGTRAAPQLAAGIELENGRFGALPIPRVIADAGADLHALSLHSVQITLPIGDATLAGTLPLRFSPFAIGPPEAPVSLTLVAHAIDLAPFAPFLPGGSVRLGGTLNGRLALEGTVAAPRTLGTITLSDGLYVSRFQSSPIRDVSADAEFNGASVTLRKLHADVGGGTLDASGELNLPIAGAPSSGFSIGVVARNAQLNFPAYGGGTIDGTAQIVGGQVRPTLSGDVTISQARIPFAAILHAAGGSAEAPPATGPQFDLGFDLRARVGKDVRVRSPNIDIGTTGALALTGSLRAPRLAGTLSATQGGVFSTYQRAFRIQHATVTFDPSQGIVPNIDLRAVAHVSNPDPDPDRNAIGSADISVSVTGPADGYAISFASDPPYPQAQILGLLAGAPLLGAVNFNEQQTAGLLRGAPGESNVLLPPGVTPYQTGSYTFGQEAFSLFSAQVTQRVFSPLERFFGDALGLDDVGITVDYGGRLGYTVRRVLSQHSNLAVNFSQVISYPTRTQFGFDLRPDAATSSSFTYFWQPYAPAILFGNPNNTYNYSGSVLSGVQPLSDRQGFRFVLTRRYW